MGVDNFYETVGEITFYVVLVCVILFVIDIAYRSNKTRKARVLGQTQPSFNISCSYLSPTEKGNLIMHGKLSLDVSGMTFKGLGATNMLHITYPDIKQAYLIMQSSELPPEVQASEVFSPFCASKLVLQVEYEAEDVIETRYLSGKPADMRELIRALNSWRTYIANKAQV